MMNRKTWIPLFILLIAGIVLFLALRPIKTKYNVEVSFEAINAIKHLSDPHMVAKWMYPFSTAKKEQLQFTPQSVIYGNDTVEIDRQSAVDIKYLKKKGNIQFPFLVSTEPLADKTGITNLILAYITNPWNKLKGGSPVEKEALQSLDKLKEYFIDPVQLYGFDIKLITVTDTTFLFASRIIERKNFAEESKSLFNFLISEAQKKNVEYTCVRIFHFEENENNTRKIFAGISINRSVKTSESEDAKFKMMPYQKNLLAVDYEGPYYNLKKINEALEEYKMDNKMGGMAIPFHKYLSDGYGFTDSQVVKLRVCYPVY
ncbi:MAG: hypothetical protein ACRC2O_14665 [Chitinophagaceae bacterium]